MDPNATLTELRELQEQFNTEGTLSEADQDRFHELWEALDEWLSKGGFRPRAWDAN